VIAIVTQDYTEPVLASTVQSKVESHHTQEIEENEEQEGGVHPSFAEILAGLLNEKVLPEDFPETVKDISFENFDLLTDEKTESDFKTEFPDMRFFEENQTEQGMNFLSGLQTSDLMEDSEHSTDVDHIMASGLHPAIQQPLDTPVKTDSHAASVSASLEIDEALNAAKVAQEKNQNAQSNSKTENASILSSMAKKQGEENEVSRNKREEQAPSQGRLDELRSLSRRDRIAFEMRDQRTSIESQTRSFVSVEAAASRMAENSVKDITLELRLPDFNNAGQNAQTTWEVKASNALENMLARELHQNFNGDIVRHASMALRDGGESIIRLNLKPETLGNVKIRLEMTDNKVTGIILVESEEALNAFKKEIAALEQAFKDAGFTDANLDLSLASDGRNAWKEQEENALAAQMAALNYEGSLRGSAELETGTMVDVLRNGGKPGSVDMLA